MRASSSACQADHDHYLISSQKFAYYSLQSTDECHDAGS